jgi:regulator of replication initiation timing
MADDATTNDEQTPNPEGEQAQTGDAPKQKTYTESEIEAIITSRLSKQEKALRRQLEDEKTQALERSKLEESERLKVEKDDLQKQLDTFRQQATSAEREKQLLRGGCTNSERTLKLLEEGHFTEDGDVDLEKVKATFPEYFSTKEEDKQPDGVVVLPQRQGDGEPPQKDPVKNTLDTIYGR